MTTSDNIHCPLMILFYIVGCLSSHQHGLLSYWLTFSYFKQMYRDKSLLLLPLQSTGRLPLNSGVLDWSLGSTSYFSSPSYCCFEADVIGPLVWVLHLDTWLFFAVNVPVKSHKDCSVPECVHFGIIFVMFHWVGDVYFLRGLTECALWQSATTTVWKNSG